MTNTKLPETITWKALSHTEVSRSALWYLGFGLISLGLIVFAIYSKSIITQITFGIVIIAVLTLSAQKPVHITYKATKTGLAIGTTLYPYKIIKTYWIIYNPPINKTLNFETTAFLNNLVELQLGDQNPLELKLFLNQYLVEDLDREESITDSLARTLKI